MHTKTKLRQLILFTGVLSILSIHPKLSAQVTVGSNEAPIGGALLQIKENSNILADYENSTKGVAFPRVKLVQRDELYPMFLGNASYMSNKVAIKREHTGLMVYNTFVSSSAETDPNLKFDRGFYVWTGAEWISIMSPGAESGLHITNQHNIRWGGSLIDSAVITADNQNIIFDLQNFNENDRKSGFMIRNLKVQPNSVSVVADAETGKLGLSEVIPARLAFIQSGNETVNPTTINTTGYWIVPWVNADIITNNNVVTFDPGQNCFVMNMDAMIEISGMVGYRGGTGLNDIIINSTIQIKKKGTPDWVDYSSVRGVYIGAMSAYRNTLNIPPAMAQLSEGDAIRMILARAPDGGSFLGADHSTGGTTLPYENGILKPYGTQFSKMLKINVR